MHDNATFSTGFVRFIPIILLVRDNNRVSGLRLSTVQQWATNSLNETLNHVKIYNIRITDYWQTYKNKRENHSRQ